MKSFGPIADRCIEGSLFYGMLFDKFLPVIFSSSEIYIVNMDKMEHIAERNADFFIHRHFSRLHGSDEIVELMRKSVREIIKNALITYEHTKTK